MQVRLRKIYKPHRYQLEFHRSNARFRILACGRRFGKTTAAAYEALRFAAKNGRSTVWIVAPTYAQSMIMWRKLFEFLPPELLAEVNRSERYARLVNGSTIWVKSAEKYDHLRGEGIDFLIVDEAAMVKKEAWEEALRPALADKQGSAVFISTPKGKNWFYELFLRGQSPDFPEYQSWQFPTWFNPYVPREEIEEARRTLPERVFKQEFEAQFVEGAGVVFRNVEGCVEGDFEAPVAGKRYFMGVDLAKYEDFTVIVVVDERRHVCHFERFNQLDWNYQKRRIVEVARRYDAKVLIDSTGVGDPIFEDLRRAGLNVEGYKFTPESKKRLIENLMLKIENHEVTFPKIPELITELQAFSYELSPTGTVRYSAPAGFHDDCVIALALAVYAAAQPRTAIIASYLIV